MSFGGSSFGGGYFGGAPLARKTVSGSGACTMAAATCAGTGAAPEHGGETVTGGGGVGFFPFPLKPAIRGAGAVTLARFRMRAAGRRRQNIKGQIAPFVLSVTVAVGAGSVSDRSRREEALFRLAAALPDEDEARMVLVDTVG